MVTQSCLHLIEWTPNRTVNHLDHLDHMDHMDHLAKIVDWVTDWSLTGH